MFKMENLEIKIVIKVWGSEEWIVNTDKYCGKILRLKEGYRCSYHHHKNKDETFYVLSGKVLLELEDSGIILNAGDSQRIFPKQNHRFTGLARSDMVEFSTHHEDSDSYRETESEKIPDEEFRQLKLQYGVI